MTSYRTIISLCILCWAALSASAITPEEIDAQVEKGFAAHDEGRFEECVTVFHDVLEHIPEDSLELRADIYSTLLNDHMRLGQLSLALHYGELCLQIDEKSGNKDGLSSSLSNLASVYLSANRLKEAETMLLRSIDIERELKHNDKLAIRLGMLSEVYTKMKHPEKALSLAEEALQLDLSDGREMKAAIRMSQLGSCLVSLKRPEEALPHLTKALHIHQQYENMPSLVITLVTLGIAEHDLGHSSQAIQYLQQCIELADKNGQVNPLITAHHELSKIYNETGDPRAYTHLEQYIQLKDSVESLQVQQEISDLEVRYDTYQKEQELEKKELLIQRQRIIYIALGITLLLVIAIALFLTRLVRMKNHNMQLKDRLMQLISHDLKNPAIAQQKLLHQLTHALDQIDANTLQQMINSIAESADAQVNLLYNLLDWAGLQTGRLRFTPTMLSLPPIVEEVMGQHAAQADVKHVSLTLTCDESDHTVTADRQMLCAMLRNVLSNAIKFSHEGGQVHIDVEGQSVTISDQGIGMEGESKEKGTGLGLQMVTKMAKINHADITISKNVSVGTRICIDFGKK